MAGLRIPPKQQLDIVVRFRNGVVSCLNGMLSCLNVIFRSLNGGLRSRNGGVMSRNGGVMPRNGGRRSVRSVGVTEKVAPILDGSVQ